MRIADLLGWRALGLSRGEGSAMVVGEAEAGNQGLELWIRGLPSSLDSGAACAEDIREAPPLPEGGPYQVGGQEEIR
jgi:hypothetical protein